MASKTKSIINLRTKNASEFSEDPTVMHLLPIEFRDYNGPARVSNFFIVKEIKEEVVEDKTDSDDKSEKDNKEQTEKKEPHIYYQTLFRGREFFGQNIRLPEDYFGLVVRECEDDEEEGQRYWDVYKYFRDFTYWNREEIPSERDRVCKWMEWSGISKMIHKPVDKDQMEKMKAKLEAKKAAEEQKKAEEPVIEEEVTKEEKDEESEEEDNKNRKRKASPKKDEKTKESPTQKKNKKL